jgi:predicted GNAT family N-acyltransferase
LASGPYVAEPLTPDHDLSGFDCGVPELDAWLVHAAVQAGAMGTARTFVWQDHGRVVAYYALAGHQVVRESVPAKIGRGGPNVIPAVILGKLALDHSLHGQGLGADLLVDALERILAAVKIVAARVLVVDAIDDNAAHFYEKFGFQRTSADSRRLVRKISDIARDFE